MELSKFSAPLSQRKLLTQLIAAPVIVVTKRYKGFKQPFNYFTLSRALKYPESWPSNKLLLQLYVSSGNNSFKKFVQNVFHSIQNLTEILSYLTYFKLWHIGACLAIPFLQHTHTNRHHVPLDWICKLELTQGSLFPVCTKLTWQPLFSCSVLMSLPSSQPYLKWPYILLGCSCVKVIKILLFFLQPTTTHASFKMCKIRHR